MYEFGPFVLDERRRLLYAGATAKPLSEKLCQVLVILLEADGAVVPKDTFADRIWQGDSFSEANLAQHVFLLRKALGDSRVGRTVIQSVPGKGYRFLPPVKQSSTLPARAVAMRDRKKQFSVMGTYRTAWALLERRKLIDAIAQFERVLAIDDRFAPAWTGISLAHYRLLRNGASPRAQAVPLAKAAVEEGLRLDPSSSTASCLLALLSLEQWNGPAATLAFDRAVSLNPGSAFVFHHRSMLNEVLGNTQLAYDDLERALEVNPEKLGAQCRVAQMDACSGDLGGAIACFSSVLAVDPNFEVALEARAEAYIGIGRADLAMEDLKRLPPSNANLARLACANLVAGNNGAGQAIVDHLKTVSNREHVSDHDFATMYLFLNEPEAALASLQRAGDLDAFLFLSRPMLYDRIGSPAILQLGRDAARRFRIEKQL